MLEEPLMLLAFSNSTLPCSNGRAFRGKHLIAKPEEPKTLLLVVRLRKNLGA